VQLFPNETHLNDRDTNVRLTTHTNQYAPHLPLIRAARRVGPSGKQCTGKQRNEHSCYNYNHGRMLNNRHGSSERRQVTSASFVVCTRTAWHQRMKNHMHVIDLLETRVI